MVTKAKYLFIMIFLLTAPQQLLAQDAVFDAPKIGVEPQMAYAFATVENAPTGAVFMDLVNHSNTADTLLGARAIVAETIEIHENSFNEGRMEMRSIENISVVGGETVTLSPTGKHIMLIGLKEQLRLENSFPLTLRFEHGGEIVVDVQVIPPGTKPLPQQTQNPAPDEVGSPIVLDQNSLEALSKINVPDVMNGHGIAQGESFSPDDNAYEEPVVEMDESLTQPEQPPEEEAIHYE